MSPETYQIILVRDDTDYDNENKTFLNWAEHSDQIDFNGENTGCGCCVAIFEFKCDQDVLKTAPDILKSQITKITN